MRFLLYSHDGLGLGHVRRNLAIASALVKLVPEAGVLLATGAEHADDLGVPADGVDVLKLPGIRKIGNQHYAARRLPIPGADLRRLRSTLLAAAVESFAPDVMLVDKHPLGVGGELRSALAVHRSHRGRTALGLRDILDAPEAVTREWASHDIATLIDEYYDRVLLYGEPAVFDPVRAYDFPPSVAARSVFCGYVCRSPVVVSGPAADDPPSPEHPRVLATVGGGEDGFSRIEVFIDAARRASWEATVVAGPYGYAEERHALRRRAEDAGVAFHTFVTDLPERFGRVHALVCMGGYNTLVEALSRGTPTVCLPRTAPRLEQLLRARAFARLGLLRVVEPRDLDADRLADRIREVLTWSRGDVAARAREVLSFAGAERAAACLMGMALRERAVPEPAGLT